MNHGGAFTGGWGQSSGTCLDTSVPAGTSPSRGHFVLKVESDGAQGSNSHLLTRRLPGNTARNATLAHISALVLNRVCCMKEARVCCGFSMSVWENKEASRSAWGCDHHWSAARQ